jgi:hypothetical protein
MKSEVCDHICPGQLGERFNKLEQLFEKFVCRKPATAANYPDVSRSPTLVDTDKPKFVFGLPEFERDTQSISSIGQGIVSPISWLHGENTLIENSSRHSMRHGTLHLPSEHWPTELIIPVALDTTLSNDPWSHYCHLSMMQT